MKRTIMKKKKEITQAQALNRLLKQYKPKRRKSVLGDQGELIWVANPIAFPSNDSGELLCKRPYSQIMESCGYQFVVYIWRPVHVFEDRGYYWIEWQIIKKLEPNDK